MLLRARPVSYMEVLWASMGVPDPSALKAYIMDVSFFINETNSLANLQASNMKPRNYSSEISVPLWAVENTGLKIADIAPFWAVVDDKYDSWPPLWTLRKDHLYLPTGPQAPAYKNFRSTSASAYAPESVLYKVYTNATQRSGNMSAVLDYSGYTNYPMFLTWQELLKSPNTASTIINLIWTDIMTNYVVGTKSALDAENDKGLMIRILRHDRRIRYDVRYGISGIILLTFYAATILSTLIF